MLSFDLLEPGLGLSGRPASAADVEASPFKAVLNVCDFEQPRYERGLSSSIEVVRRPINDIYPVPLPYLTLATLELVDLRRRGVPTLVHCQAGRSRSPTIIALYWMARDGLDWDTALARVIACRSIVDPNPFFRSEHSRAAILSEARALMTGETGVLDRARARRAALVQRFLRRTADVAQEDDGWNLVDEGLAIGGSQAFGASLHEAGIREVVLVGDIEGDEALSTFPSDAPPMVHRLPGSTDAELRTASGAILALWQEARRAGRPICVLSGGDEASGTLAVCVALMAANGWDRATALWYLASRRATAWTHVGAIWFADRDLWPAATP